MRTGSKILFIEDESNLDNKIIDVLEDAGLINGDVSDRETLNKQTNGDIVIATSFQDAFKRITALGDGSEYEWIFLDRNLAEYEILSENSSTLIEYINNDSVDFSIDDRIFSKKFFNGFVQGDLQRGQPKLFVGDYLFIMLINAGVPVEKICFLTANNDASMEELTKSPYLHKKRLPEVIEKTPEGYKGLVKKLQHPHNAKIRFLYRDIFHNKKVDHVFGSYIEDFIAVLAKRYKSNADTEYTKGDGIVLRNMVESVVSYIADDNNFKNRLNDPKEVETVRRFLNCNLLGYSGQFEQRLSHIHSNFVNICNKLKKKVLNKNDKMAITKWISDYEADLIIEYSNAKVVTALNDFYFHAPYDFPPKYIFSYIDNIYTVTSEFSAHGKNDKTTDGLSSDGWSALLSGMLQIMQWVTDTNP